ncbi:MAG: hypothetical protein KDA69_15655 [Planctomycetaceae bacterium]|nr:hypothetical protein [Planctomycetaceae bacterium]
MKPDAQEISGLLDFPNTQSLRLLLRFGADHIDSDIDLLAIYAQEPPQRQLALGRLDVFACSVNQARELTTLRDPVVTEPTLQGTRIAGSKEIHAELLDLLQNPPASEAIQYLVFRSCTSFGDAAVLLSHELTAPQARIALTNLSFAASYLAFAQYYGRNDSQSAIKLDALLQEVDPLLASLIKKCRNAKASPHNVAPNVCADLYAEIVQYMLAARS